jgi:hypothetical protein
MKLDDFIKRADDLIQAARKALGTRHSAPSGVEIVDLTQFQSFRAASLSFFLILFDRNHPYYTEFDKRVVTACPDHVKNGLGILQAARDEIAGGWTTTVKAIVSAEIFSDFLEMASYLLTEGYKDAAAVMVGSVLEEHLRQLCRKAGIAMETVRPSGDTVPQKADALNADLAKQNVYSLLDQKNVTAWLDLRNKAAHGKYNEYTKEQVNLMHQGVVEFMTRVPV